MKRFFKWFAILAFLGLIATGISFMGMRLKVGQLIGDADFAFVQRSVRFAKDSIPGQGERYVWAVTWGAVRLPGIRTATVWVSPTGNVIATDPADLEARIAAYERSREP